MRLRALRDRWAEPARSIAGLEVLTPPDPRLTCAISSFRLTAARTMSANRAVAQRLLDRFGIYTIERDGVTNGACVRVTPGIFTEDAAIDKLVDALRVMATEWPRSI